MKRRFKNIKVPTLAAHFLITLGYPVMKGLTAEGKGLLVFTDVLTIMAGLLLIVGIFYALYQKGDFDRSAYRLQQGVRRGETPQSMESFLEDRQEKRENSFNYPLFVGLVYVVVALILAYTVL